MAPPLYYRPGNAGGGLPTAEPGKVLGTSAEGELVWMEPQSKFRGAWAADSLAKYYDFTSGVVPPEFTKSVGGVGVLPAVTTISGLANHTHAMVCNAGNIQPPALSRAALDLASLGIAGITRLTVWIATEVGSNSQYKSAQVLRNGGAVVSVSGNPYAWTKHTVSCDSNDVVIFEQAGAFPSSSFTQNSRAFFAGIDIYAAAQPYMRGEYVTHQSRMWLSEVDNNAGVPGVAGWTQALDLPVASGPTANRPAANLVGAGYQYYDTTLGKPIWSNGTAWRDSTGTAV